MSSSITYISSQVHMVSSGEGVPEEGASDKLQHSQSPDRESHSLQQIPNSEIHASRSEQDGSTPSITPKRAPPKPDTGIHSLQSDQEGISSIISEKVSQTPDTAVHALHSGPEGSTSMIREKASEDGYNWRKYGQKFVKGNEFIRSYYKCTHPNCQVKKQLERTHDGQITDTIYLGQHDHPRPQLNLPLAVGLVVSIVEERPEKVPLSVSKDKSSDAHGQTPHQIKPTDTPPLSIVAASDDVNDALSPLNRIRDEVDNDNSLGSKRQKKDNCNIGATPADKPTGEPRLVVQTLSEVDIVNDGYRWRKYGQKLVKGNANPRSYYRCSSPGCPVKKHVERAPHDPKLVITTYEGQHDHDMPPVRTVTHNTTGLNSCTTAQNGESGTKLIESDAVCLDMVVHSSSGPESKSNEDLSSKSKTKSEVGGNVGLEMVVYHSSAPESESTEQQNGKSGTNTIEESESNVQQTSGSGTLEGDAIGLATSVSESRSQEQLNGESGTKSKENGVVYHGTIVEVNPDSHSN